ncbi:4845_t:CDS:2 [Cetraspora pellucida]|uniref:4845_t:CDS:1 n=1 Tax=Cetraspora pellucida TaxID=1433469 RepID=A0ACA9KE58_9GLOM|nr:4845_t:CDS:2 [Cetraspora pellucida]
MDKITLTGYTSYFVGGGSMITLHHLIVAILMYKIRPSNGSNLIKVFFNFSNFWRFVIGFAGSIVPPSIPFSECLALQYLQVIGDVLFRESLSAFLLWRLRQIHYDRRDQWVSIILFTIKTVLTLPILALQRPNMIYKENMEVCNHYHGQLETSFGRGSVIIDFIIDVYVTARLVQILKRANRNAAQISTNMSHKSKRSLFTAVMYWNFLRMFFAFIFHLESMVTLFFGPILGDIYNIEVAIPLKTFINIALSYVITVDAEIVKVIEGRNPSKDSSGGSAGPEKSFKSLQSPRTPRTPPKYKATQSSVSRDIPSPSFKLPSAEQTSQIDNNKLVVVSMKRLSFFEWAGFVAGKRFNKNTLDVSYEDETETTDADVEKGLDKRRGSDLSNASTSSNSTDDNYIVS